jgi:CRISPR-associated endonuclease/helicase Cas3
LEKPLVIVATQTIEAGVDIDLDGLVTEAAALDALRQRFGRLNRAGREISPVAAILAAREDVGTKADDPVYGDRIAKTWNALCTAAGSSDGSIDFGIEAFPKQLTYQATNLVSPKPDAPVLMPAYADLWSQTWPVPKADPEIALFLHGANRSPASVQVVWRADIRESDLSNADEDAREAMLEAIRLMPPRPAEAIEIPLWAARAWLRNQTASLADLSDAPERAPEGPEAGRNRRVFRYAGGDNERSRAIDPNDIVPGDLIVVPAAYGGCDEWGWILASKPQAVDDVAHAASWPYRYRRYAVRVTAELMHQGFQKDTEAETGSGAPIADIDEIERKLSSVLGHYEDAKDAKPVVDAILALDLPKCLQESLQPLHDGSYRRRLGTPFFYRGAFNEPRGVVFVAPFGLKHAGIEVTGWEGDVGDAAPPATESDEIGLFGGYPLLLKVHSDDVRRWACDFSGRAGLPPEVAADVALAGYLHDCGKSDRRFQTYLAGGDLLGWQEGEALAKSGRDRLPKDAWERSGLPDRRWRHEARSVRLALNQAEFAAAGDQALVLWLVGVHHGFGRPFFPHADPDEPADRPGPQSLAFDFDGRDWPGMFEKLKRDYGIWGLARLEAFVRLADHRASEEAERRYANEGTR